MCLCWHSCPHPVRLSPQECSCISQSLLSCPGLLLGPCTRCCLCRALLLPPTAIFFIFSHGEHILGVLRDGLWQWVFPGRWSAIVFILRSHWTEFSWLWKFLDWKSFSGMSKVLIYSYQPSQAAVEIAQSFCLFRFLECDQFCFLETSGLLQQSWWVSFGLFSLNIGTLLSERVYCPSELSCL